METDGHFRKGMPVATEVFHLEQRNTMMTAVDLKLQRSDCFKLLSACFYEPDKDLFLQEGLCQNLASLLAACGLTDAALSAEKMRRALVEKSSEEMAVDFARLFVGPFELVAPPYGSVYLEKNRRLMGDSTMAVHKIYQEAGLSLEVKEAPDHIALELEFMHYLCLCEAEAATKDNEEQVHKVAVMQAGFMQNYLGPWIRDFCGNIRTGADHGFYTHLADCLEGFIVGTTSFAETAGLLRQSEETCVCRASA